MFKKRAPIMVKAPVIAPAIADGFDDALVQLIEDMSDQDPQLTEYQQLQDDRSKLVALRDALATTTDPKSLIAFANSDKSLSDLLPGTAAVESATSDVAATAAANVCAKDIDKLIKDHVDPAIEAVSSKSGWAKIFDGTAMLGFISAFVALHTSTWFAGNIRHAIEAFFTPASDKPGTAPDAHALLAMAVGIDVALASLVKLAAMPFPATAAAAEAFSKRAIKAGMNLSMIGISVTPDGDVSLETFPADMTGTASKLGYDKTIMKNIGQGLDKLSKGADQHMSAIKTSIKQFDDAGANFMKGDASDEDKKAVKAAVLIYKNILMAGLRRVPKATVYTAKGTKRAMKAFYVVSDKK